MQQNNLHRQPWLTGIDATAFSRADDWYVCALASEQREDNYVGLRRTRRRRAIGERILSTVDAYKASQRVA